MIISVGYRVKSKQGTQFRIWANQVLKDYLLKGYLINNRMNRIEDNFQTLSKKVDRIELQIITTPPPVQGVFFNGTFSMLILLLLILFGWLKNQLI